MHANIGRTVKDSITGFTGTAIGHGEFLSEPAATLIQPAVSADGSLPTAQWLPDHRLQVVGDDVKLAGAGEQG